MPTFTTETTVYFTDSRGREVEADVEVTYTFAGGKDDLPVIIETRGNCFNGYDDTLIDELVWEAVCELCDEAYAEWDADRGEYLNDMRADAQVPA